MNELDIHTGNQTPIEIALGVDDEGMTTARKLYEFLELDKSHYGRWAKSNITDNVFAVENEDYWRFAINGETPTGGKIEREDYKLTSHFAKRLCMQGKSIKGELARQYFIGTETALKKVAERKADDIAKLKASYYDMTQMFQKSQQELLELRQQFAVLEQRQSAKDEKQYESTYENRVAKEFFKTLKEVLTSDDHSIAIKPKRYHGSLTLVGIYDDAHIYIGKEMAYNIYEQYGKRPVKAKILWEILTQTGYVDIMADAPKRMMIGWCNQVPLVLYRDKVEFLISDKA